MGDISIKGRSPLVKGGRVGKATGGWTRRRPVQKMLERMGGGQKGKPHSTPEGRLASGKRSMKRLKQKALNELWLKQHGGGREGKPHFTKEGQKAAAGRKLKKIFGIKKGGKV